MIEKFQAKVGRADVLLIGLFGEIGEIGKFHRQLNTSGHAEVTVMAQDLKALLEICKLVT